MTYEEIGKAWRVYFGQASRQERFGQWFLNRYFPEEVAPEIFYAKTPGEALQLIMADPRFYTSMD